MLWVILTVILVLAVVLRGFRKFLLIGAGVVVALVLISVASQAINESLQQSAHTTAVSSAPEPLPAPPTLIPVNKINIGGIRSNFGANGASFITRVSARLFNNSESETLDSADFHMLIDDCTRPPAEQSCATVHEQTGTIAVGIPPQQAGDVAINITEDNSSGVSIKGTPRVRIVIKAARASID